MGRHGTVLLLSARQSERDTAKLILPLLVDSSADSHRAAREAHGARDPPAGSRQVLANASSAAGVPGQQFDCCSRRWRRGSACSWLCGPGRCRAPARAPRAAGSRHHGRRITHKSVDTVSSQAGLPRAVPAHHGALAGQRGLLLAAAGQGKGVLRGAACCGPSAAARGSAAVAGFPPHSGLGRGEGRGRRGAAQQRPARGSPPWRAQRTPILQFLSFLRLPFQRLQLTPSSSWADRSWWVIFTPQFVGHGLHIPLLIWVISSVVRLKRAKRPGKRVGPR